MNWKDSKLRAFLANRWTMLGLFVLLGVAAALLKFKVDGYNNFLIFRGVFGHVLDQSNLYAAYPDEYGDINHYGPLFSILVAPFAVVPIWLGLILWNVALAVLLYWADKEYSSLNFKLSNNRAPLGLRTFNFLVWFTANELYTALCMQQFNIAVVAFVILSFVFVEKGKDEWATLCVVLGTMTKLYGIVALPFFFFSKHKGRYIATLLAWIVIGFCLPMFISSPAYVIDQYHEWFIDLVYKNSLNLMSHVQNVSTLGLIRKVGFGLSGGAAFWTTYSDKWILLVAMTIFAVSFFQVKKWNHIAFRQTILASVLMMINLFSSGSESNGYIIALTGVAIWYMAAPWKRNKWDLALLIFCFIVTSLSPTDLFPRWVWFHVMRPYALKALPVTIIWLQLCVELLTHRYEENEQRAEEHHALHTREQAIC